MSTNRALLIAIPVILAVVLLLTFLRVFSSYILIAVIFVLYVAVSLFNRRKFKKQAEASGGNSKRESNNRTVS